MAKGCTPQALKGNLLGSNWYKIQRAALALPSLSLMGFCSGVKSGYQDSKNTLTTSCGNLS